MTESSPPPPLFVSSILMEKIANVNLLNWLRDAIEIAQSIFNEEEEDKTFKNEYTALVFFLWQSQR